MLKQLVAEMKAEIAEAERLKNASEGNGSPPEEGKVGKKKSKKNHLQGCD